MADDDPSLTWWRKDAAENHVQRLLRTEEVQPSSFTRLDPATLDGTGNKKRDRFFEWSVNGRTIYMRVGPVGSNPFQESGIHVALL